MKLTKDERKAIFAGDSTALKRQAKPEAKAGEIIVLAWSRGGKQFVGRSRSEREDTLGTTIEVPRKPTVWIVLKEPSLKEGRWVVEFDAHDERKPVRTLAAPPSPPREAGLKTRWNESVDPEGKVRTRKPAERGKEISSFTDESARGYGGGGKGTVDELEGVDDPTLAEWSTAIAEENEKRQRGKHGEAESLRHERRLVTARAKGQLKTVRKLERVGRAA